MSADESTSHSDISQVGEIPGPALNEDKLLVIYVLGGPGVGKGTQCERLVQDFGFAHFSVGDLLREEQGNSDSPHSKAIQQHMVQGTIVPAELALTVMKKRMAQDIEKGCNIFLIDGFPRSMEQALSFEKNICKSRVTLFLDCSPEVMLERVLVRAKTSQRIDDTEEMFWKRWNGYKSDTMPVLDYFRTKDKVITIDCAGPFEAGYAEVKRAVESCIISHLGVEKLPLTLTQHHPSELDNRRKPPQPL